MTAVAIFSKNEDLQPEDVEERLRGFATSRARTNGVRVRKLGVGVMHSWKMHLARVRMPNFLWSRPWYAVVVVAWLDAAPALQTGRAIDCLVQEGGMGECVQKRCAVASEEYANFVIHGVHAVEWVKGGP
jgi:hypothetical protein